MGFDDGRNEAESMSKANVELIVSGSREIRIQFFEVITISLTDESFTTELSLCY